VDQKGVQSLSNHGLGMIDITDLVAGYDGKIVLSGLNFSVREAETVSIMGVSGSGKSTILRVLAGLQQHVSGRVAAASEVRPALVDQQYRRAVFPWLTVRTNVALAKRYGAAPSRSVAECLKMVGLGNFAERYPYQLSGGECQRLVLARAIYSRPNLLLLDEPFASLDAMTRIGLQAELEAILVNEGISTVLVTHDFDEALYLADRVYWLSVDGGLIREVARNDLGVRPLGTAIMHEESFLSARSALLRTVATC